MYLAFNAPHFPLQARRNLVEGAPAGGQSYLDMYADGWTTWRNRRYERMLDQGVIDATYGLSLPDEFANGQIVPLWSTLGAAQKADLARKMALHAAMIEAVDTAVGRVTARLKAAGQLDDTLILVMTDNGGNYEGGIVGKAFDSPNPLTGQQLANMGTPQQPNDAVFVGGGWASVQNTPFRLFKHYTHGGGVRSPLVVSWPKHIVRPGQWTNQVAHVIDVAPTILAAAGVEPSDTFDGHAVLPVEGVSLLDTLADGATTFDRQIGFEHETNRAFIAGNFKLVVRHENDDQVELYDLQSDPSEINDLAGAQPVRVANLVRQWNEWASHVGVPANRQLAEP